MSLVDSTYLGIDGEDFSFRYSNLEVAELVGVSVSKTSIEGIPIRREQCLDILKISIVKS